jgi:membrane protein DedA with SNARE-associated domain
MSSWIEAAATWLVDNNLQIPLFVLLIALVFAEGAAFLGLVLPGETALITGGVLAYEGVWPIWLFVLVSIVAAVTGDSVGFYIGHRFGDRIKSTQLGRFVGEKRWKLAQHIFDRYHWGAIFFGRAQGLLRALIPALAAMNKVKYRVFIRWNALGATIFAGGVAVLGYVFAGSLNQLEEFLKYWAIGFFALIVITVLILKRKLEHLLED